MSELTTSLTRPEERALSLLGRGHEPGTVASAVGLSESRILELLADPDFANRVAEARFKNISSIDDRDTSYNDVEDILIERLKRTLPMLYKPAEVLRAIQVINSAKRRGTQAPLQSTPKQEVVPLLLPQVLIQKFTVNSVNQVISAGGQSLITIQSSALNDILEKKHAKLNQLGDQSVQDAIVPAISSSALTRAREEKAGTPGDEQTKS